MFVSENWYLQVDDIHRIYYQCKWNPNWEPIIFLHWWPGVWFSKNDEKFFDFDKHFVIFFDQRWAWKSKREDENILNLDKNQYKLKYDQIVKSGIIDISFEEYLSLVWKWFLENNTVWYLLEDINKLLDKFNLDKVNLFWGSWGSTLALVYAINYPNRVKSMILRWIYLPTLKIYEDFFFGNWIEKVYPDIYERFLDNFPKEVRFDKQLLAKYIKDQLELWNILPVVYLDIFETQIMYLDWRKVKIDRYKEKDIRAAIIEFFYLYNGCFLKENYILKNVKRIENIPIKIVQWRYDMVCPAEDAYKLYKSLKNVDFKIVLAGHSAFDKETFETLKNFVKNL